MRAMANFYLFRKFAQKSYSNKAKLQRMRYTDTFRQPIARNKFSQMALNRNNKNTIHHDRPPEASDAERSAPVGYAYTSRR